jgi:hypothetical protein
MYLGMTKAQVTEALAGNEFWKADENNWTVAPKDKSGPSLQFTNGRLGFADRNWPSQDNDIAEAYVGAVRELNNEGFSWCVVSADSGATPDMTKSWVRIACGPKTVLLLRDTFGGKSYNLVYEQLGTIHKSE